MTRLFAAAQVVLIWHPRAWFSGTDSDPDSHVATDVVGEDAAILVAAVRPCCSARTSSSWYKKLIALLNLVLCSEFSCCYLMVLS
jgi:hypothetical protein